MSVGSWLGIVLCIQICLCLRSSGYQREGILGLLCSCRISSSGVTVENLRARNSFWGCLLRRSIGMIIMSCWNLRGLLEPILLNFMDCRDRKMDHSTWNRGSMAQLQKEEARSQQQLFYLAEIENLCPDQVKWELWTLPSLWWAEPFPAEELKLALQLTELTSSQYFPS